MGHTTVPKSMLRSAAISLFFLSVLALSTNAAAQQQPVTPPPSTTPLATTPSVVTLEADPAGTPVGSEGGAGGGSSGQSAGLTYQQGGGFVLRTPDDRYVLTIGGYTQLDVRSFPWIGADAGPEPTIDVRFRRARVQLHGTVLRCVHWALWVDFARGAELFDAYLQWFPTTRMRLTAGHFVTPFGLERQWTATTLPFMERSVAATALGPDLRRLGVMLDWQLENELLYVALGIFKGSAITTEDAADVRDDFDAMARAFVTPIRGDATLHVGVAGTIGRHRGDNQQGVLGGSTMLGHRWFPGASDDAVTPDGTIGRVSGELDFTWSRLRISGELVYTRVDQAERDEDAQGIGAWGTAAFTFFGEPANRRTTRSIRHVDPATGHAHVTGISDAEVPWSLELAAGFDWARLRASFESTPAGDIRTEASYSGGRFQLNLGRQSWLRLSLLYAFGILGDDARRALSDGGDVLDIVHELGVRTQVQF